MALNRAPQVWLSGGQSPAAAADDQRGVHNHSTGVHQSGQTPTRSSVPAVFQKRGAPGALGKSRPGAEAQAAVFGK